MIAYKLQLQIIVMPFIIKIIMISGAVLGGPGPRTARRKAGKENSFSTERLSRLLWGGSGGCRDGVHAGY